MTEAQIRDEIVEYLEKKGVMVWLDKQVAGKTKYHFKKSKGVPDICGILQDGSFLGIEVKTPKGKLSEDQKTFIKRANKRYAVCFVARSLQDVFDYEKKEKIIFR